MFWGLALRPVWHCELGFLLTGGWLGRFGQERFTGWVVEVLNSKRDVPRAPDGDGHECVEFGNVVLVEPLAELDQNGA